MLFDSRSLLSTDFYRGVPTATVYDQPFIRPGDALERSPDSFLLVLGDKDGRNFYFHVEEL